MPESDYQIPFSSSGASAAATIYQDELPTPIELNGATVTSTAATASNVAVDVTKNGTSVFTAPIGNVYQSSSAQGTAGGISSTTQTSFDFVPVDKSIEATSLIQVDSEIMLVTKVDGSPSQTPGGTGVQRLTVTRAQLGTAAATHAANANVLNVKPTIPTGGTASTPNTGQFAVPVKFNAGDLLAVVGATGATNLSGNLDVIDV